MECLYKTVLKPDVPAIGRLTPGFLKLHLSANDCMHVCVCLPMRLPLTSGVIWIPYDWLNKFYSCYMATVVGIIDWSGLGIDMRRRY